MTRVLFLNTRSAIGADVAVHLMLIRHLDPARCRVHVATNSRADDAGRMRTLLEGVPHARTVFLNLGSPLSECGPAARAGRGLGNLASLAAALPRLAVLVNRWGIQVIHTTDRPRDALMGTLLARLTGRRSVVHMHIGWDPHLGRATNWALSRCDAIIAISGFVAETLAAAGIARERIHTALNAVDAQELNPAGHAPGALRGPLGLTPAAPVAGIAGRLIVWKGHLDLVAAWPEVLRRVPGARLAIVGASRPGPDAGGFAGEVAEAIRRNGLEEAVVWAGWHRSMAPVYADLDVLCVPSREEPFGLVVAEAMAMETPVVGWHSGALPEIIEDGVDGRLVPPRDTEAYAGAVAELLTDATLRREMGQRARQKMVDRFTPRRLADDVAGIYERLAGAQPGRAKAAALRPGE